MATAKFKYGAKAKLQSQPVDNGAIYVTTDTKELAVDLEGERLFLHGEQLELPLSIEQGGTGETSADAAWKALGGGDIGKLNKGSSSTTYLRNDGTWATPTNTDTKVTETIASDNAEYPILTKDSTAVATVTASSKFAAGVTVNPSTKTVTATTFKGALDGNATSATSATFSDSANVATSAAKLSSSKNLGVALGTSNTTGAAFDGSANQLNIPVSGTLGIANGGTGAANADDAWSALGGGSVGKLNTGTSSTTFLRNDGQWATPANTDTKVTETVATDSAEYPILTKNTTATATITDTAKFAAGVTINPSTKTITATTFKGALTGNVTGNVSGSSGSCTGNAATATTAGNVTGTVAIANGGTGKTTAPEAWTNLGGGSVGKLNTNASQTQFLRGDGTWQVPPNDNTWTAFAGASSTADGTAGYVPAPGKGNQEKFFRADGTWAVPTDNNTDVNVKQDNDTSATAYPILLKNGIGTGSVTTSVKFNSSITVTPSTGTITATTFKGKLDGNAATATKATSADSATKASSADTATTAGNVTGIVDITNGGTGKNNAAEAWTALGGGSVGKLNTGTDTTKFLRNDGQWAAPATGTDINVKQDNDTSATAYPILLKNGTGTGSVTSSAKFNSAVTVTPSTGLVTATTFKGALNGNASTATTAGNVTGVIAVANGGTGATNATDAWTALGGGDIGKLNKGTSTTTYLRNDGTWGTPPNTNTWQVFIGATDTSAGTDGYVSAPGKGNQYRFFQGSGKWVNLGDSVSILYSYNDINPATIYGGSWTMIKDYHGLVGANCVYVRTG